MVANHIHDALGQVRKLRAIIWDRHVFRGYSGRARVGAGATALAGAFALDWFANTPFEHLLGWGAVLGIAIVLNYGALLLWFVRDPERRADPVCLVPALDALPPLACGAVVSFALIAHGYFDLLFGTWMVFYGLAHVAYRDTLPRLNYAVGVYYALCGTALLALPVASFTQPLVMGSVFFIGELGGGMALHGLTAEEDE